MTDLRISEAIFFDRNSYRLSPTSRIILDELVRLLQARPDIRKVAIQGHATIDEKNPIQLSEARARSVRDLLLATGVEPERLLLEGHGLKHPLASPDTLDGRNRNRRVDFDIVEQEGLPPKPRL